MPTFSPTDGALIELARALQKTGYQFTTPTPATHERVNSRAQSKEAKNARDVFGWSRRFRPEILPEEIWQLMQSAGIAAANGDAWRSSLRLSSLNNQLFWHSAFPTTENDTVFFGPDTFRFAAAICELFTSGKKDFKRIVDIGCGAGPGAILCALACPHAEVFAADINDRALRLARINAKLAGTSNVEAVNSDLLANVEGEFDLVISNPPYLVDDDERAYRHGGGPLGAELSLKIVEAALERLAPQGMLLLYTGVAMIDGQDPFLAEVEKRLSPDVSWNYREVDPISLARNWKRKFTSKLTASRPSFLLLRNIEEAHEKRVRSISTVLPF
jgi:methylase of polypeptide subunit release factors